MPYLPYLRRQHHCEQTDESLFRLVLMREEPYAVPCRTFPMNRIVLRMNGIRDEARYPTI